MSKQILITGGAGFVGFHLASRLAAEENNELFLVDNFARGSRSPELDDLVRQGRVHLLTADLTDSAAYKKLPARVDEVYHLAAVIGVQNVLQRPHEVVRVNAMATLLLLDWFAAGRSGRFLFASTSEAYAWTRQFHEVPIPTPENVPLALTDLKNPRASYAGSKIFGELAVTQYCQMHDQPFAIVRYHNVYGPRMGMQHVIPELWQRASRGDNPLEVYSPGHSRAFCYVEDAVAATISALRCEKTGGTYHVGNDTEEITIGELAKKILSWTASHAKIEEKPAPHDPINRRCPDISLARRELGFEPQVSLEEGLHRTLSWYAKQHKKAA